MRWLRCVLPLLWLTPPAPAQGLVNGSFDQPPVTIPCEPDTQNVPGWTLNGGSPLNSRNGDQYVPECPRDPTGEYDAAHATRQGWSSASGYFYQTVSGLTPGLTYSFAGWLSLGQMDTGKLTRAKAELHNGTDPNAGLVTLPFEMFKYGSGQTGWRDFITTGTVSGSVATVVIRYEATGTRAWAVHVDDCTLLPGTCTDPPAIQSISPTYEDNTHNGLPIVIAGSHFVTDHTTAKLIRPGQPDVPVSITNVIPTHVFGTVNLSGAAHGRYSVQVTVDDGHGCPPAVLDDAFLVVLPAFTNGGFEQPDPGNDGCEEGTPTENGPPDHWLFAEIAEYGSGSALYRDDLDTHAPRCPPPDGHHYASSRSENASGGICRLWQTFKVSPNVPYTLSALLAGGGDNTVTLSLLNGDEFAPALGQPAQIVANGTYDWSFLLTQGTPGTNLITVQWKIELHGQPGTIHASHADAFAVGPCTSPITLMSILPPEGLDTETVSATITGTGFAGTPLVQLVGPDRTIPGEGVVVFTPAPPADPYITCDFDLVGATSGYYDLVVRQGSCVATLPDAFLIAALGLRNGEFEEPPAAVDCATYIVGGAWGWNHNDDWWREHNVWRPTCPRSVPNSGTYGHFASMTTGEGEIERAWQVVKVIPGYPYRLAGYFAGGGTNTVRIRLLDAAAPDPTTLSEIASTTVYNCASGCSGYDWSYRQVAGPAATDKLTVLWEMTGASDASATHADGLSLGVFIPDCGNPFADFDHDLDVDQADWGLMQACLTGQGSGIPGDPFYCICANAVLDFPDAPEGIDQADIDAFEACATGPNVPANPACDGVD